MLLMQNSWTGP